MTKMHPTLHPTEPGQDLRDRVALVTGGAERVGRVISLALARAGANLAINHFQREEQALRTRDEARALGRECVIVEGDISDPLVSRRVVQSTITAFGRLDVLVHNASNFAWGPFLEADESTFDASFGVNLRGPFFLSQAAARHMLEQGSGRIIAVVGNSYYEAMENYASHAIAKTGLAKLIQTMAIALSPVVQCNAVCPGPILAIDGKDDESQNAGSIPVSYAYGSEPVRAAHLTAGSPEDLAELVVFLAACRPHITGAIIPIDGGRHLWR